MNNNENQMNNSVNTNVTTVQSTMNKNSKNNQLIIIFAVVVAIVGIVLYSTLFKSKTLSCSMSEEQSGMTMESTFDLKYQGKKLKEMDMKMEIDLGEYSEYKDMLVSQFESQFSDKFDEINKDGGKASLKTTDDSIVINISASRSGVSTMLSVDDDKSYDEMKKQIEDIGYTCK